jgi:LysM repeat protein
LPADNAGLPIIGKHLSFAFVEDDSELKETSMVTLALVFLAILLGGAGFYLGLTAKQQIAPLTEFVDVGSSSDARINKQLSMAGARIDDLSLQNAKLKETIQRLDRESSQASQEAKQVASGVQSNRGELIELAQKISQLAASGSATAASRSRTEVINTGNGASATETTVSSILKLTYKIQSGDTFGKIASQKNIRLDDLLEANPDVDPRRLSIGKEINIPAN